MLYFPSMSVFTPIVVPLISTFAKGRGWFFDSLSKSVPETVPLVCAKPIAQINNVINTNFNFILIVLIFLQINRGNVVSRLSLCYIFNNLILPNCY